MQAVKHSWRAYEAFAWGMDELTPLTKGGRNSFGGLGATLIDSLDTLHMMGMHSEFRRYSFSYKLFSQQTPYSEDGCAWEQLISFGSDEYNLTTGSIVCGLATTRRCPF